MSSFGAKRKARKITVQEEEDDAALQPSADTSQEPLDQGPALQATFKTRKPIKQSSLRKSIALTDEPASDVQPESGSGDNDDSSGPVVIRPALGSRGSSLKPKKRSHATSKLSFGVTSEPAAGDDDVAILGGDELPAIALKKERKRGIMKNSHLPLRSLEADEARPRYSKEYLSELQSSTPNTPAHVESDQNDDVEMSLDPSELEGATVVSTSLPPPKDTKILTESQIVEKKARRARLSQQTAASDFISLSDDERGTGDSYLSVLSRQQADLQLPSKSKEKRLTTDDNLDDDDSFFVEDGGLSLGKKAERAARKKKRSDMASLIAAAEGSSDSPSDDSEAERRAAYEVAQTRAGMDGLGAEREAQRQRLRLREGGASAPPKLTPLPDLSVVVGEFREKMKRKEEEVRRMRARIEELRVEKEGIERREPEVQKLLNNAGERYRALMGGPEPGPTETGGDGSGDADGVIAVKSLLDRLGARPGDTPGTAERGLDSLGTTPVRTEQMEM
jgi:hypothetical protein